MNLENQFDSVKKALNKVKDKLGVLGEEAFKSLDEIEKELDKMLDEIEYGSESWQGIFNYLKDKDYQEVSKALIARNSIDKLDEIKDMEKFEAALDEAYDFYMDSDLPSLIDERVADEFNYALDDDLNEFDEFEDDENTNKNVRKHR